MAFSGTVGTTTVNVAQLMGDAAWLCGKKPQELTAEYLDTARRQLFYLLMASANLGINLWCITNTVIGIIPNRREYDLPLGTVEVLNIQYRRFTRPAGTYTSSAGGTVENAFDNDLDTSCTQVSADGRIYVDYGSDIAISVLGFMPDGTHTYNLVYEYSDDAITWKTAYAPGSAVYTDREWVSSQIMSPTSARYFGVRETGGATLSVREAVFGTNIFDIQLPRENIDDFQAIPRKDEGSRIPPVWWFNRVLTQPKIQIWPPINYAFDQMVVYRHRQIMDVGDLTNQIEIPDRWLDAVVNNLALRLAMTVFSDVDPQKLQSLQTMAQYSLNLASNEEKDIAPCTMAFSIGAYTR